MGMFSEVGEFLAWFESVHRRTVRDVSALPAAAELWLPPRTNNNDEGAWGISQIVAHIAEARSYFASAFLGRGWIWDSLDDDLGSRATWPVALETSMQRLRAQTSSPGADPDRRVAQIGDATRHVSGWRVLMMMAEHEIAHRAQISTYAGLNGWPVEQLFGRDNEWVRAQRPEQLP